MQFVLVDIFSLLCAISGWFYLFYSKAASRLAGIESPAANARRVRLRRVCGAAMLFLAACVFYGANGVRPDQSPRRFLVVWILALVLLGSIVILAMADLRLTIKLREQWRKENK